MSSLSPSPTSAVASPTSSHEIPSPEPNQEKKGGVSNSPLIFFVALGFGVIFTNLWIIVGVKYCFRYSRIRAAANNADGEQSPSLAPGSRRRREKKVLTPEQVNQLAPLVRFSTFIQQRQLLGSQTAAAPPPVVPTHATHTRTHSVKEDEHRNSVDTTAPPRSVRQTERPADNDEPEIPALAPATAELEPAIDLSDTRITLTPKPETEAEPEADVEAKAEADAEAKAEADAEAKAEAEAGPSQGIDEKDSPADENTKEEGGVMDICTICFDSMSDEEMVRGLPCGHPFHSDCLDPWLTNRRACCPNCKAEYYVAPEELPAGDQDGDELALHPLQTASSGANGSTHRLRFPQNLFFFGRPRRQESAWSLEPRPAGDARIGGDQNDSRTEMLSGAIQPSEPEPELAESRASAQGGGPVRQPLFALRNPFRRRTIGAADIEAGQPSRQS